MVSQQSKTLRFVVFRVGVRGRLIGLGLCLLGLLLFVVAGPGVAAWYARQSAEMAIKAGRMTDARFWLEWAAWYRPRDGRTDIVWAAYYRRFKDVDGFVKALDRAEKNGAPPVLIDRERRLAMIQAGRIPPGRDNQIGFLIAQGYDPAATVEAFVYGALARGDAAQAWEILSAWAADLPDDANQKYMAGIYWQFVNQPEKAEEMHRAALQQEPHHELAMLALAEILSADDRWQELYQLYDKWHRQIPRSIWARMGLARTARLLGRWNEARQWLNSKKVTADFSIFQIRETAELLLEINRPDEAMRWFQRLNVEQTGDRTLLHSAALAASLEKDNLQAAQLMDRADALFQKATRTHELRMRLAIEPKNQAIKNELASLSSSEQKTPATLRDQDILPHESQMASLNADASSLYIRYCAACHGDQGHGDGRAARFLFPRARNLRRDAFRIVSTEDAIPTVEDVVSVLRQGMPGTAMRSFTELSEQESLKLAEYVLDMFRDGVREQLLSIYAAEGETVLEDDLRQEVSILTTPGKRVSIPTIRPANKQSVTRGKESYLTLGCANCHGEDGTGACDLALWDDQGFPDPPRNLKHDFFKGGDRLESLYLRLRLGMPGTAHPSCLNAAPEEIFDVVLYCQSLIEEPRRITTNDQRWEQARVRAWYPAYLTLPGQ